MSLATIAREWKAARTVISRAAAEAGVQQPDGFAEAVIARLASHNPPILLEMDSSEPNDGHADQSRYAARMEACRE